MATNAAVRPALRNTVPKTVLLWALQLGAAYVFLMSSSAKLTGAPMMVQTFAAIGLGQWFRYFTGSLELLGALALLIPAAAGYGASLLAVVMIGAVATHLLILGGSPLLALALLIAMLVVAWGRLRRK